MQKDFSDFDVFLKELVLPAGRGIDGFVLYKSVQSIGIHIGICGLRTDKNAYVADIADKTALIQRLEQYLQEFYVADGHYFRRYRPDQDLRYRDKPSYLLVVAKEQLTILEHSIAFVAQKQGHRPLYSWLYQITDLEPFDGRLCWRSDLMLLNQTWLTNYRRKTTLEASGSNRTLFTANLERLLRQTDVSTEAELQM